MDVISPKTPHETELKLWQAIEELRVGKAVFEQKLDDNIQYQRTRNHDIMKAIAKIDAHLEMMRVETKQYRREQEILNHSYIKKALIFLGATVVGLLVYIWQGIHPPGIP